MSRPETKPSYRESLRGVLDAIEIFSAHRYSWLGERRSVAHGNQFDGHADIWLGLQTTLQTELYANYYVTGGVAQVQPICPPHDHDTVAKFSAELARNNRGSGCLEPGWQVVAIEDEQFVVENDGLRIWVHSSELGDTGAQPAVGSIVELRRAKELHNISPGYVMMLGDRPLNSQTDPLVRFYWNVDPSSAACLVNRLTNSLNSRHLPFRFKILTDPRGYTRCDSAVLYARREDYVLLAAAVASIHSHMGGGLSDPTPSLTLRLDRGLGLAEDPGGQSFGLHRSGLIAQGIVEAFRSGDASRNGWLRSVERHLGAEGISLRYPYRAASSAGKYEAIYRSNRA